MSRSAPRTMIAVIALSALPVLLSAGCAPGTSGTRSTGSAAPAGVAAGSASGPVSRPPQLPAARRTPTPSHSVPLNPPATRSPLPPRPTVPPPSARPPFALPTDLLGRDIEVIPGAGAVVALTFDAGANADGLASILATLSAQHIRATFFLTGNFATVYPDRVRAIVAAGHRLGNHSVDHPYFTGLTDAQIRAELSGAEAAVTAAGGSTTKPLFRFPFGDRDARTIAAVNAAGYLAVRWTVDTLGWKGTSGGVTATTVVDRVVASARPGEIVLMHVGSNPDDHSTLDADALPTVISRLRALGYSFTTLDALLS